MFISLISDAGTPAISDPGSVLVNKCINEKLNIIDIDDYKKKILIKELENMKIL